MVRPSALAVRTSEGEVEFGRLLDRQVAGICPAQYFVDVLGGASKSSRMVRKP